MSECTIALVEESDYAKNMECKEVIYASTVEDCIRLVNEKKADLGFDNRATVDYYIYDIYANLVTDLRAGHSADICVTVSDRSGNELLAILKSYIGSVGEDVLENTMPRTVYIIRKIPLSCWPVPTRCCQCRLSACSSSPYLPRFCLELPAAGKRSSMRCL